MSFKQGYKEGREEGWPAIVRAWKEFFKVLKGEIK